MVRLAELFGIQTFFTNMEGKRVAASATTIKAILGMFDAPAETEREVQESIRLETQRHWNSPLDPVTVCWDGKPRRIRVRLPRNLARALEQEIRLENGSRKTTRVSLEALTAARTPRAEREHIEWEVPIPELPFGCHELEIRLGRQKATGLMISAPSKSYSPTPGKETWGLFAPLYALHSKTSWGAGNFSDLRRLNEWVAAAGGSFVATLPLNAAFLQSPVCEPSPYSPASRLFWNEFFLDIPALPEFSVCPSAQRIVGSSAFQRELGRLRTAPHVDYATGMWLRRTVLDEMARTLTSTQSMRREEFEKFLREHKRLLDYAEFRAVCDKLGKSWHAWESRLHYGKIQVEDYTPSARQYHAYVQWAAEQQVRKVCSAGVQERNPIYLDLPLGVNSDGYDLWRERDSFAVKASVGAPPDAFFSKGQDWGFAPPHPRRTRERRYGYIRECFEFQMRHASMLRIDHVMGLHRLYWIPHGLPGTEGAYVRYRAEEFYALLNLESHRNKTVLVGENLGTVPPEVNADLKRHGFRTMYVVPFEQRPGKRPALSTPPKRSVASLNTHDMPSFAAHVTGADFQVWAELGLIATADLQKERRLRAELVKQLAAFVKPPRDGGEDLLKACIRWLSKSPAESVLITLEDLWGEMEPQNIPGTSSERPNWRRKMRYSLEELEGMSKLINFLNGLRKNEAGRRRQGNQA